MGGGSGCIGKDQASRGNKGCGKAADSHFFLGTCSATKGDWRMDLIVCKNRATVTASYVALLFKVIEISPNGWLAGVEPLAKCSYFGKALFF